MRLDISTDRGYEWAELHARFRLENDSPIDFCFDCANREEVYYVTDQDHPPYEDWDYRCVVCRQLLTGDDD